MPTIPVAFPNWARIALGLAVVFAGYLVASVQFDENTQGLIAVILGLVNSAGVVPPIPATLNIAPAIRWGLSIVTAIGSYFLTTADSIDGTLRGVLQAAVLFVAWLIVMPPQAIRTGPVQPRAP